MKKTLLLISTIATLQAQAQNLGVNTLTPHASSIMDITHTSRGLLIPRLPLVDVNDVTTIASPALSLLIFNTATAGVAPNNVKPGFYYFNGTKWVGIGTGSAWDLLGNTGTNAATNFIGTTDAQDLVFKTNGVENMRVLNSNGNVGIGTATPLMKLDITGGGIKTGYDPLDNNYGKFSMHHSHFNSGDRFYVGLIYNNSAGNLEMTSSTGRNIISYSSSAGYGTQFSSKSWGGSSYTYTPQMYIDGATGNVGIGSTSPAAKLQVMDNANRRTLQVEHDFNGLTNTDAAFIGGIDAGYTSTGLFVLQKDAIGFGSSGTNLLNVVKNSVSQMVVNGVGYVGIGMPTPSVTLDVQANTNVQAGAIARFNRTGTGSIGWLAIHSGALAGDWSGLTGAGDKSIIFTNDNNPALDDPSGLVIAPWTNGAKAKGIKIMESGNVGVGTGAPAAILDVTSTTAGFAMPRMTSAQRKAIVAPIAGLDVYDLTLKGHYTFDGTKWDCSDNPAGSVNYFANATAPNGYLECNGQSVSTTTYAELFAAIGYLYGGAGASFNVPDLRGEFVRGVDNARGVDAGRTIGTWQEASVLGQTANYGGNIQWDWTGDPIPPRYATYNKYENVNTATYANTSYGGSWRSRPRNVAMLPCIKF